MFLKPYSLNRLANVSSVNRRRCSSQLQMVLHERQRVYESSNTSAYGTLIRRYFDVTRCNSFKATLYAGMGKCSITSRQETQSNELSSKGRSVTSPSVFSTC